MNQTISQFLNLFQSLPLSRKISMALVLGLVIAGFVFMFIWSNQEDYQILYNNLTPEDGGDIVAQLKEQKIPYRVEANGSIIMVPSERVYEVRLALAAEGIPRGGNTGFEIFDTNDFRTTKFVQELNYRRALQGELARTINQFEEVRSSKVFIVIPKESLFVEESKPASASIQVDLKSSLPPGKFAAIIHLVASAVEGLDPEQVTVVDTKGRVIFKGTDSGSARAFVNNAQLEYTREVEDEIRKNVQTMLEGIVGIGRAIVRVNAEIDFNKITLNEEEYDSFAPVVRSTRHIEESTNSREGALSTEESLINQRRGVVPAPAGAQKTKTKKDVVTNYEINKITRTILKPAGTINRLSVAAVIDGTYRVEKREDGTVQKNYIPRTEEELKKFEDIVKRAMGYSADREDQVSVSSIAFADAAGIEPMVEEAPEKFDILRFLIAHRKAMINMVLVCVVFFLIVRLLLKSLKSGTGGAVSERFELPEGTGITEKYAQISDTKEISHREKALEITRSNPGKTEQLLKEWVAEKE
jgi:flagellar M-ring protein FliF